MEQVVSVGLGEIATSDNPDSVLVAFGLGSCLGIVAYDPVRRMGGLLHAMLPTRRSGEQNPNKFVDTGMIELINRLCAAGARRERLVWRLAGGAQMLTAPGLTDHFNIGAQNIAVANEMVAHHSLRVVGHDTGGYQGRTVRLSVADGSVTVRTVAGQERTL